MSSDLAEARLALDCDLILADYALEVAEDLGVPMSREEADAIGLSIAVEVVDLVEAAVASRRATSDANDADQPRPLRPE